jgi:cysteine protease avirulence protein AvrRpt2
MPRIRLDVPLVAQEKANCCWHTSAYMIWLYWQKNGKGAGPMFTIPSSYAAADTKGIGPAQFITLAKNVGLDALPVQLVSRKDIDKHRQSEELPLIPDCPRS